MTKKKKIALLLLTCLMLSVLTACPAKEKKMDAPKTEKLTDYLYYMELEDYNFFAMPQTESPLFSGGCSSVRKGDLYGRNLDLGYCETPEFIVRINAAPGRFASIGVCADPTITVNVKEMTAAELRAMPNITNDGINENGVIISENVVDATGVDDMTGTAPGKEKIHASRVVRYLLDRATSAEDAVRQMEELNIVGSFSGYGLHWMIADEKDTFIVEIINGSLAVSKNESFYMTNFYLNYGPVKEEQFIAGVPFRDMPLLTDYAIGVERWCSLRGRYDTITSEKDMKKALASVSATTMYEDATKPAWSSECIGDGLTIHSTKAEFEKALAEQKRLYEKRDRKNPQGDWITWHSSVYNIKDRTLTLYSQEDYSHNYRYTLK